MTTYLDSSILLRRILGQPDALAEFRLVRAAVASRLLEVECLRALDRLRVLGSVSDRLLATLRGKVYESLATIEIMEVTRAILSRAAGPTPTSLGALDAIHLASAVAWRERSGKNLVFATHDEALGVAAAASGFRVLGV